MIPHTEEERIRWQEMQNTPIVMPRLREITPEEIQIFEKENPTTNQILILNRHEKEQSLRNEIERIRPVFPDDKALAIVMTSRLLLSTHHVKTLNDDIYVYSAGVYQKNSEQVLTNQIQDYGFGKFISRYVTAEIIGHVKRQTFAQLKDLEVSPNQICVANGILDLSTGNLSEHNPEMFFTNKIPVDYVKDASCPAFLKFLDEVLSSEDIPLIQELFGYCLLRDLPVHKSVMLTGGGANGKSTLLNVLKSFLGPENVTSVSLQALEEHQFFVSELFGKLANVYPDLPPTEMEGGGVFKCLTGQDQITAERKHGQPFNFVNYAKLIFSANQIPAVKDDSDAFYRRWIIIQFNKQFLHNPDTGLLRKLTTSSELQGILQWSLKGLQRVVDHGFSHNKTVGEVREHYTRLSNPLRAFVEDAIDFVNEPDAYIAKDSLFREFMMYCKERKLPTSNSIDGFSKKFYAEIPQFVYDTQKTIESRRIRVWMGVRLKQVDNFTSCTPCTAIFPLPAPLLGRSGSGKKGVQDVQLHTLPEGIISAKMPVQPVQDVQLEGLSEFLSGSLQDFTDLRGNIDFVTLVSELSLHPKIMTEENAQKLIDALKSKGVLMDAPKGFLRIVQ